ncbi:MAG TPA: hypothetical protein VGZ25_15910 [Gemmataceae bacterium]|jgi:hypothetical protein|nr:hypothetical protein [Gemmataceae bacterium]
MVLGLTLGAAGGFLVGLGLGRAEQRQPLTEVNEKQPLRPGLAEKNELGRNAEKDPEPRQDPPVVNKASQSEEQPAATHQSANLPNSGTSTIITNTQGDRDRSALIDFVKKHAQKPANLEIVELGAAVKGQGGAYSRSMVIRCDLIDFTPNVENFTRSGETGQRQLDPKPLSRDSGTAYYTPEGNVARVHLDGCSRWW